MKIYLARHGQDEDNASGTLNGRRDTPLTDRGVEQARILAETIRENNVHVEAVYCSPLQRTKQTASIVCEALGLRRPEELKLLIERDFGIMTGLPTTEIESRCAPDIIIGDPIIYFLSPSGAETFPDLIERGKKVITWVHEHSGAENVLLVTHGDIGKMIYAAYYNLDWKEVLTQFHFGNSELLVLSDSARPEERHLNKVQQYNS